MFLSFPLDQVPQDREHLLGHHQFQGLDQDPIQGA